ncbi:hypothetical protein D9613_012053 [Agrocybe pediades]|uniref:Uncharacterized protein n=1 Tax=Agrocybe pediades TaxID=84607 RepID=A0A8H4QFM1_9AGAR|nr:hypothetical protein D9613_012053 [Agrocybe pediades]
MEFEIEDEEKIYKEAERDEEDDGLPVTSASTILASMLPTELSSSMEDLTLNGNDTPNTPEVTMSDGDTHNSANNQSPNTASQNPPELMPSPEQPTTKVMTPAEAVKKLKIKKNKKIVSQQSNIVVPSHLTAWHDFYGNTCQIGIPLLGIAVLFKLSRFEYGIIDANNCIHVVHAAQLREYIHFAYYILNPKNQQLFEPLGYREFLTYLHRDPNPNARLTTIANGKVLVPPPSQQFPVRIDFPTDAEIDEFMEAITRSGGIDGVGRLHRIAIGAAERHATEAMMPTSLSRDQRHFQRNNRSQGSRYSSTPYRIPGGRM